MSVAALICYEGQRKATIAATAFANSQALPILFIDVIGPDLFGSPEAVASIRDNMRSTTVRCYCMQQELPWEHVSLLTIGAHTH